MQGNDTALKELWERLEGKVLQTGKVQLSGAEGKPITVKVVYENGNDNGGSPTT